jgi:hypothetical protein
LEKPATSTRPINDDCISEEQRNKFKRSSPRGLLHPYNDRVVSSENVPIISVYL